MKRIDINTPKERKTRIKNKNNKSTDKSILFRFNLLISNPILLTVLYFIILAVFPLLINYVINLVLNLISNIGGMIEHSVNFASLFSIKNCISFDPSLKFIYIIVLIVIAIIDAIFIVKINISYKDFDVGQKGGERWSEIEELREQYKAVPMKDKIWQSERGGIIITRDGNNFLVDEEPGHNLVVGTSRSGKGEMFVKPNLDILSRCSCKPSLIVTDPKLELTRQFYNTLINRGYKVISLNLIDPSQGDCYNPFSRIVDLFKSNEEEKAYQECRSFSYSIFHSKQDEGARTEEIWQDTATDLLSAFIISNLTDCINLDKKEQAEAEYSFKCKQAAFLGMSDESQDNVRNLFKSGELTIDNSEVIPTEFVFDYEPQHEKEINMFSVFNSFRLLAENVDEHGHTALDKYFKSRPLMDKARIFYSSVNVSGYRTKSSVYISMLSKLTAYSYDSLARMTSCSDFELRDIGFGSKPLAIFIAVPDYDESNHFFITTFIRQVYYVLSSEASRTASGKCSRPVWHILDEFGNTPALDNIQQMVSIGAGLNMFYNFIIQDFAQLDNKYDSNIAKIIRNNCQNQIFIKSNEYDTAEQFSKLLGNETITNLDRIGRRFALDKTYTERKEERSLLNANELMALLEGECVVKRVMKRKTLDGKDAIPHPIFNTGSQRLPYAHKYLSDVFVSDACWTDIRKDFPPIIPVESFTFNIVDYYNNYVANTAVNEQIQSLPEYSRFLDMLLEDGEYHDVGILRKRRIVEFLSVIQSSAKLSDNRKKEYIEFLKSQKILLADKYRDIKFK